MKKSALYLVAVLMTAFMGSAIAQDDLYYDPSDDYYQDTYAKVSEDYSEDDYAYEVEEDDCNYCYSTRVRRFRNSYRGFNYYDPCYTDSYYYGATPGTNVYVTFGSPYSYYNYYRPSRWNNWAYNPYNYGANPYFAGYYNSNPYFGGFNNPYSYGFNNFNTFGGYGGYGYGYGNDYCPPSAYGGNYAASTPGNSNYSTPRPSRPSNYSTGGAGTNNGGVRPGTTSAGTYTGDRPTLGKNQTDNSVYNVNPGQTTEEVGMKPGVKEVYPIDKPDQRPTEAKPRPTTKPSTTTTTRTKKSRTFFNNTRSSKPTYNRSNRSSSKPSYTPRKSNSSYKSSRSSSGSNRSSYSPSRSSSSPKSSTRSSSGGRRGN